MRNVDGIKTKVESYIENNMLKEAEELIFQYREEFECEEIASMESIINLYRGDFQEAMNWVKDGLAYNIKNGDLYYNMGIAYESRGEYNRAYLCYEHSLEYITDENSRSIILRDMDALKSEHSISVKPYSIVILTYNNLKYTQMCIESIKKFNRSNDYEIIIVDNNSIDGTQKWLESQSDLKCILNAENKGFPGGCNQGIKDADLENDIFLLNNDTVLMENSIFNLRMALYSKEKIGAVGPVTNNCCNYQEVTQRFSTLDQYKEFAERNNITNENLYEKRVKLVGFAMLIKREVLNKTGLLDERFFPGNFEDDDLSYRILKEDYELLVCLDSYIHHFGSVSFKKDQEKFNRLLKRNSGIFEDKWGFNSSTCSNTRYNMIAKINKNIDDKFNVLQIRCGCGGTLLTIKNIYHNSNVYGIESNKSCADVAKHFLQVEYKDIDNLDLECEENYFDYIILAGALEHVKNPDLLLDYLNKYLKDDGCILK